MKYPDHVRPPLSQSVVCSSVAPPRPQPDTYFTFVSLTSGLWTSGPVSLVTNLGFGEVNFLPRNLFPIRKEQHHVMSPIRSDPPIPNLHSVCP